MLLIYGLVTGILFGILLQRAEVIRYDRQLGALRLLDMTIVKFMLSAIIVGMIGLGLIQELGVTTAELKPLVLGAQVIGGLLFGVGWALLGYCPGTSMGALGEGRLDAFWGIVGGLFGAAAYAELYPGIKATILSWGQFETLTLYDLLGLNHWIVIAALTAIYLLVFRFFEKHNL